ncbi:HAMP domain-containing sensor histidine kinase [Anoxynatronum sibiricum]|uniref:Heme sensor protein HssS n=1 Tax=Anoxynatronum sibiricum TaxID=210623 RepID=A0ABU9VPA0_9CLOT
MRSLTLRKITVKLVLFFTALIMVSSLVSFIASMIFAYNVENEIRLNQQAIARTILELEARTDLSLEDILQIASTFMYDAEPLHDADSLAQLPKPPDQLPPGESIFLGERPFHGTTTLLKIGDTVVQIRLRPQNTTYGIAASRSWRSALIYVAIGAVLASVLARRIVRPIIQLNAATKEIARGHFDIQLATESHDELGQLTQNFNRMARELKHMEYLHKDFIASVSHEFKTPIASILGFARLLQKGNLSASEREEYTRIIVEESARLSHLSSNIIRLSKLENQEIVSRKDLFYLDEQIRKCILLLEPEWDKKSIEWDIQLDRARYPGDEELLQQVWINLIGNAIKFSHQDSLISIALEHMADGIRVTLKDEGTGMDQQTVARIFEKFYQGDAAHSSEGSGLGLPLVKRILDLHDGTIQVTSKPGEGTSFTVELPITTENH